MEIGERPRLRLVGPDERAESPVRKGIDFDRWMLVVVAVLQLLLGFAQAIGVGAIVDAGHIANESAAWNLAVGAAYATVAARNACPTGLMMMLTAFVATLLLLSAVDLLSGRVDAARLGTHVLLISGFLLVLRLARRRDQRSSASSGTFRGPGTDQSSTHPSTKRASCESPLFPAPGAASPPR